MVSSEKGTERDISSEKTEAILCGAMQEFLAHGYAGARIDGIVAAAGVSKATVYRHFADKEAMFTALIQRMAGKANLFRQYDSPPLDEEPAVFLRRYATGMLDSTVQGCKEVALLRIIMGESGRFPELAQTFVQNIEKPNIDFLTQYFTTHPKLQIADPEVTARTLLGTLIHFVMVRNLLHGAELVPMDCDRLVDGLLKLLIPENSGYESESI